MHEIGLDGIKITSLYAAYIEEHSAVVMADLHIGYESYLQHEGVSIPKYQKKIMVRRVEEIMRRYEPEKIIINGDFKHEFGKNLRQEWREVDEMLSFMVGKADVVIVRGNHDNFLKTIASRHGAKMFEEYSLGNFKMVHGHRNVKRGGKMLIIGHEHPSIEIRDEVGAVIKLPCYLYGGETLVLPAMSPLAAGTDVISEEDYLSPILREMDTDKMDVYAINENELLPFSKLGFLRKALRKF